MTSVPKYSLMPPGQEGMVLITGMIFMVVLTLIVVASMRTTILEERMAGNARDNDLAFQAAEAALRAGEQVLTAASLENFMATSPAYLAVDTGTPKMRDERYWMNTDATHNHNWATNSLALSSSPAGVVEAPRFVVEELPPIPGGGSGSLKGPAPLPDSAIFRVTARGVGGNPSTVVYLQTTYRR